MKIKNKILSVKLVIFSLLIPIASMAQTMKDRLNDAIIETGQEYIEDSQEFYFAETIGNLINIVLSFLGVIFVILIIYGGFMWMTAGGKEQQVEDAKKVIIRATIGIAVIMLAYAVTWFIISKLGTVTGFETGLE